MPHADLAEAFASLQFQNFGVPCSRSSGLSNGLDVGVENLVTSAVELGRAHRVQQHPIAHTKLCNMNHMCRQAGGTILDKSSVKSSLS